MKQDAKNPAKSGKKVLFLITKATWGGAQRYVYDLATHLPKDQFEPIVAFGEQGRLEKLLNEAKIETHQLSALGRDVALISDISSFFQILVYVWRVRPDVIHLNSSKAAALGALGARICRVPRIIFTVHGWPFKEQRNMLVKKLICMISWFTGALSHEIIVVSKTDLEIGKTFGVIGKKMKYIPLGIETPVFLSRAEASTSLSITTTNPRIVTIAELTKNKGILYAIEAIAELKKHNVNVSYFIIGEGEEHERLAELVRTLDAADCVHFLGFIPEAPKYLKAFDVFVLPSIKEGMPYVLLEAAAAGLPIIATDVVKAEASDLPNIHFVPPENALALADALKKLAQNLPIGKPGVVESFADMLKNTVSLYQ